MAAPLPRLLSIYLSHTYSPGAVSEYMTTAYAYPCKMTHQNQRFYRSIAFLLSILSLTLFAIASPVTLIPDGLFSENTNGSPKLANAASVRQEVQKVDEANIAYFIQVAESTALHLPRLLDRLYHPKNAYAIHFDLKMSKAMVDNAKKTILSKHPSQTNIIFLKSELITYRGVSMVLNTINAMKVLLEKNLEWHYFINISGSDYPLVSPLFQRRLLGRHIGNQFNFVTFAKAAKWNSNIDYRMRNFYVDEALSFTESHNTSVQQLKEQNPLVDSLNFQYTNSEAWMINSRQFCRFVVTSGYARKMLLTFAFSVESSEHYFSTLLWNHPKYNHTIVSHSMRQVVWSYKSESAGQHPFYVDDKLDDGLYKFKQVVMKSPNFFSRKFRNANSNLMDILDSYWDDPQHIAAVKAHYSWQTSEAIREHRQKPAWSAEYDD